MEELKSNLGKKAKDKVTGFSGTIIGFAIYLYGCSQYGIASKANKDGKYEVSWFDSGRIAITGNGVRVIDVKGEKPGAEYSDFTPR